MNLESQIESILKPLVLKEVSHQLEGFATAFKSHNEMQDEMRFGIYLTPEDTCKYISKKSKTGLKELLLSKGIKPIKFNDRFIRYDRHQIDEMLAKDFVEEYTRNLKRKIDSS